MTDGGERKRREEERRRLVRFSMEDGINYVGLKRTIPENQGLLQQGHSKSASHETITTQRTRKHVSASSSESRPGSSPA